VSLSLFYSCCKSNDEYQKKVCDPSLSDAKIAELEKCDEVFPKEVKKTFRIFIDFFVKTSDV
jgi:hypothetical protein